MPLLLLIVVAVVVLTKLMREDRTAASGSSWWSWSGASSGEAGEPAGSVRSMLPFTLPSDVDALAQQYAQKYGLNADFVRAQIWAESQGNQNARSPVGAIGLMQLMPSTAAGLNVNPYKPAENVDGGTRYFADLLRRFGSYDKALAAYNWGEGRVTRAGDSWASKMPAETRNYITKIFSALGWSSDSVNGAEGYSNG